MADDKDSEESASAKVAAALKGFRENMPKPQDYITGPDPMTWAPMMLGGRLGRPIPRIVNGKMQYPPELPKSERGNAKEMIGDRHIDAAEKRYDDYNDMIANPKDPAMRQKPWTEWDQQNLQLRPFTKDVGPPAEGTIRLYRVEPVNKIEKSEWIRQGQKESGHAQAEGRWFTDRPENLDWYRRDINGPSKTVYVDVPLDLANSYRVTMQSKDVRRFSRDPQREFFLPSREGWK